MVKNLPGNHFKREFKNNYPYQGIFEICDIVLNNSKLKGEILYPKI